MLHFRNQPSGVVTFEPENIPAIFRVVRYAEIRRSPVARGHIDERMGGIAIDGDVEVGIYVVAPDPVLEEAGELGPQVGVHPNLGLPCQALKIDVERIGEACA
jgi:hypothetical protein